MGLLTVEGIYKDGKVELADARIVSRNLLACS